MAAPERPPWRRRLLILPLSAFCLFFFFTCLIAIQAYASLYRPSAFPAFSSERPGLSPRRLLVAWTVRKFFLVNTPETLLAERAKSLRVMAPGCDYGLQFLYSAVLVAGKHTPARSALIDTSVEDIIVAFFRIANLDKGSFPLKWYALENALKRSHTRAIQTAMRRQQAEQQDYENDPDREKPLDLSVPEYTWMVGQQARDSEWYYDGNTFHKRGDFVIPEKLTEHDLGFMKSLPFNVLRVAKGIERENPKASVAHLIKELEHRDVRTANDFFLKTNFLDILVSTNVIDETFLQIDIISEYVKNWEAFKAKEVIPPSIPLGAGYPDLLKTLLSKKSAKEKYPKCPTMKCYVESVWTQRSEHPIDKEDKQKQKEQEEEKKKEQPSEPFAELMVKKKTSNALKIIAIGNTGHDTYRKTKGFWGALKRFTKVNELERTVEAMRQWHQREVADIALGLGDFLRLPGITSVREQEYKTKWHDVFVGEAGLDIPWFMVNGVAESIVSPSASFRYHYTRQDVNYHNPNWVHKSVITMVANLTTADGGTEDQEFTIHLISINTWALFGGPPLYDNLGQYQNNMIALSNVLFHSAKAKADWIIVQGHLPLTSTGPKAEKARLSYIEDMVKSGRARGPENRLVELLTAYQVDAYVSGHDHAMEYMTMSDLEKNTTLAFITSGGGTRIMDDIVGRGWMGVLRGRLFPLLCWSGKRIFYKLDPGGCRPSEKDQALAYKFYAPQGSHWKISVKERILHTTGFVSMKVTKDFLIVDFISSQTGKPTGRKLHKHTNREARAVKFIDFWEDADLKLKELNIDHNAFEEENRERVASEIAFQTRTPILAERVRLYEKELADMYNEYQQLKAKKAMYETMSAQKAAALEAQGESLRESELSEGMYEQTERIIELMYIIAADHMYMWERYEALKALRKGLPESDVKQAEALLKMEKKFAEVKKQRREINKKYVEQGGPPSPADAEQIKELVMQARILKTDIAEMEKEMGLELKKKEKGKEEEKPAETEEKTKKQLTEKEDAETTPPIKPLDTSVEARLERKKLLLEDHIRVMKDIEGLPAIEKNKIKDQIGMLSRQKDKLVAEIERLEDLLSRKAWAADRRPSELWEKRMQKHDLEQTMKQLEAYRASIINLPKMQRRTKDLTDAVSNIELQKLDLEEQLMELNDELYQTEETELQKQFKTKMDKLRELFLLVESRGTLPAEALEDPEIKKSLEEAESTLAQLQIEVESLDESVRKELSIQDEAWVRRMIIRGADVKELAEEFSLDVTAVREEDAKLRKEDPKRQLHWLAEQEWAAKQRLSKIEKLPPEHQEKAEKDKEQILARLEELSRLKTEAEGALAAREAAGKGFSATTKTEKEEEGKKELKEEAEGVEEDDLESKNKNISENNNNVQTTFAKGVGEKDGSTDSGESGEQTTDDDMMLRFDEVDETEGMGRRRRLAGIMEWFQPKKEETPVKELPKIDLGPKDPCEGEPMLYVVVKKAINAEYGANFAERCKKVFANRSHRSQRRFIGLFDDSGNPAFYEWPNVHITDALKELYGTMKVNVFAEMLKTIKTKLIEISSKIEVATFEEITKGAEETSLQEGRGAEDDEFVVPDDE